jgi:CRISPR/Cas system CSM-associated protein Csm4 (group 5 of RAMP superfamily)
MATLEVSVRNNETKKKKKKKIAFIFFVLAQSFLSIAPFIGFDPT